MPSLSQAPERHSSLPPLSPPYHRQPSPLLSPPPASRQSTATLENSPVTPRQYSLSLSSRAGGSSLPPPYSAAKAAKSAVMTTKSAGKTPGSTSKTPKSSSSQSRQSSTSLPVSNMGALGQSYAQLEGHDIYFCLIDHTLAWKKIPRMSRSEFEAKLCTDTPAAKHWRKSVYSKDWLLAQLFHYDLFNTYNPYGLDAKSTEMVLKQMLSMAAANGMCDSVPERILMIEAQLREKADREFANQLVQRQLLEAAAAQRAATPRPELVDGDVEEYDGKIADPWAELHEAPGAQANLDADRFFNHYFLKDGKPDRKKTRRGLRLDGLAEHSDAIIRRAERYGLYRCVTKENPKRVCLGWDLQMVQQMAEFTDKKIRERRPQFRTREETRLKEAHDQLAAQCQRDKGKKEGLPQEWDIAGQYMMTANELLDHCSPEGPFTLNISDKVKLSDVGPGRRAGFDLCVASGSMLLATSSPIMDWLLADAEKDHQARLGEAGASRKRKLPPTEAQVHHRQKRDVTAPRRDQKKCMNYELRLRGQEVVGEDKRIFHQPRSGHIRFKDNTFLAFTGRINMGESLGLIDIQGFKYSLEAPRKTPKWNDFTEAAAVLEQDTRRREVLSAKDTPAKQSKKVKTPSSGKFSTPKSSAKLPCSSSMKK